MAGLTTPINRGSSTGEKVVMTTCTSHCGGVCILKVHVKDGQITRIETDNGTEPQYRACVRGRAYRQRVYAPDRVLYPLHRVGERGKGEFKRISWDEALDMVAGEIKRVRNTYGPAAMLYIQSGGDVTWLHNRKTIDRLLCMSGGYSRDWGWLSHDGLLYAMAATYGTFTEGSMREDLLHSRMIIMWGWDPATTIQETNCSWYIAQVKESGARIISVDPRYTESAAAFARQWIPIRPGTDVAALVAMAHVIIAGNLQDQVFLDKYTVGFPKFKDYVLGVEDGVAKTPAWAETICGIPAATLQSLAREYASTKPAALVGGYGPGRSAVGEQFHRAVMALAAMTGNVGKPGGDAGVKSWSAGMGSYPFRLGRGMQAGINVVEKGSTNRPNTLPAFGYANSSARIPKVSMADAILKGKAGGYTADYKMLYTVNVNYINQLPNSNKIAEALKKLEFIVVQEQFMTATARYADIVLPTCTILERNDLTMGGARPYFACINKVIEPVGEARTHLEIAEGLAQRLGIKDYNDKDDNEWVENIVKDSDITDYKAFRQQGSFKMALPEPYVAFRRQIEHPEKHPFPTPSGKIEFYSQLLADMNNPLLPPVPKYIESWESPNDPLAKKYPLQLITSHFKLRAHSQFNNLPWLQELIPQRVTINPEDAQSRGIKDSDMVRVFNDRGEVILPARVSERIMPGVVDVPQGAWYRPDEKGVDRGGCANTLTRDELSPGGALSTNTALVQVERV